jgi:hypothetical protein
MRLPQTFPAINPMTSRLNPNLTTWLTVGNPPKEFPETALGH